MRAWTKRYDFNTVEVDESLIKKMRNAADNFNGHVVQTRPYKKGPGIEYAEEVITGLHNAPQPPSLLNKLFGNSDTPPTFSYELWYDALVKHIVDFRA